MRFLNRIILINSAHVKYVEINLDGNVHFIGTQGVGKSTLLRTILFFYNADTFGLGIPRQKMSYTDYYFQKSNSYVIYEVLRDDGIFCVVSYKSQHKVCFRFFDGEYKREYFVNENGAVPDNWEGIAQRLDADKVFYTKRKIEEHKEYRDIIYGNHDGKKNELRRYSLLESRDYQYLPKTIQNVFLNSKMDAEFIKQTIIMSLENDVKIDLNSYLHHLKDFETQINDIKRFKTPTATAQATEICKLNLTIKQLEREKVRLANQLSVALKINQEKEPEIGRKKQTATSKEAALLEQLQKLTEAFRVKEQKIRGEISILDHKLKIAKQLSEDYEKKNIHDLIRRIANKPSLEKEQKHLESERNLLTTEFKELTAKYQALLDQFENQWNDQLNTKNAEKNKLYSGLLAFRDEQQKAISELISQLRTEYKEKLSRARDTWEDKKQASNHLKIQKEGIKHKRFYESELKELETARKAAEETIHKYKVDNAGLTLQIETTQKNWELDEKELLRNYETVSGKLLDQIKAWERQVEDINLYLESSKESLSIFSPC